MSNKIRSEIDSLRYYNRSSDAHNRQIVVNLRRSKRQIRFTEDEMHDELINYQLDEKFVRKIGESAFQKAMVFVPGEFDYEEYDGTDYGDVVQSQEQLDIDRVQNLLCEFQSAVDSQYGQTQEYKDAISAIAQHIIDKNNFLQK